MSPLRWVLRLVLPALILVGILMLAFRPRETETVSDVIAAVHDVALQPAEEQMNKPQGGWIGPLWVSAASLNTDGELVNLKIEHGAVHVAAQRAKVAVDPRDDTFTFQMWGVVVTRVQEDQEEGPLHMRHLERYSLGPLPYRARVDIVEDRRN